MDLKGSVVVVDFTTKCNCLCPGCGRTENGELNTTIPIADMSLETFKKFFTREVCNSVKKVLFCPSYGEPPFNPHLLDCVKWVIENIDVEKHDREHPLPRISIATNGGNQTEDYWKELAIILNSKKLRRPHVTFAIDGLEDTNHLYRTAVKWDNLMRNAKAFISNGGRAQWQFISFEHNAHQVEQAKKLSEELGFIRFVHKVNRYKPVILKELFAQKQYDDENLKHDDKLYNKTKIEIMKKFVSKYGNDYSRYLNECDIKCRWFDGKEIFFQFDGKVWPCCHLSNCRFRKKSAEGFNDWAGEYDSEFNNINHHSLEEILKSEIFTKIKKSVKNKMNDSRNPRFRKCAESCGELFSRC